MFIQGEFLFIQNLSVGDNTHGYENCIGKKLFFTFCRAREKLSNRCFDFGAHIESIISY